MAYLCSDWHEFGGGDDSLVIVYDDCNPHGVCNSDVCECEDGWYGSRCHLKSVDSMELQIAFDYKIESACLVSKPFDPLPLNTGASFTLDLVPPIRINGTRV
eukprot:5359273-Ditylum_brightwellii.AAC.1